MKSVIVAIILVLMSLPSAYAKRDLKILGLFCTSALNHPKGVTTLTFTGRRFFNLTNVPFGGVPFSQTMTLVDYQVEDRVLRLDFKTEVTRASLSLEMNKDTNNIVLSGGDGRELEMTCQANIQVP